MATGLVLIILLRSIIITGKGSQVIRGEPERAPNTEVAYGEFAVPMYVCMYVASDTSSTWS